MIVLEEVMRYGLAMSVVSCAALIGCASAPETAETQRLGAAVRETSLVGTWRLVSMRDENGKVYSVDRPFFMRFYAGDDCASWPTPAGSISRGKYSFVDGRLSLPGAAFAEPVQLQLTEQAMSYTTAEGGCDFRRVVPDLSPGDMP